MQGKLYSFFTREKIDNACTQTTCNKVIGDFKIAIFTEDELCTSTVTGKNSQKPNKLDAERLSHLKGSFLEFIYLAIF